MDRASADIGNMTKERFPWKRDVIVSGIVVVLSFIIFASHDPLAPTEAAATFFSIVVLYWLYRSVRLVATGRAYSPPKNEFIVRMSARSERPRRQGPDGRPVTRRSDGRSPT